MKIAFAASVFPANVWNSGTGKIGDRFGYDTETTAIVQGEVPPLVLATACNGREVFFIRREDLAVFWQTHATSRVIMHSAAFDMAVTSAASGFDFQQMIPRITDIAILYRLYTLASIGNTANHYSLEIIAKQFTGVTLDKNEDVRLGFGQFIVAGQVQYQKIPEKFLQYAALDAVATYAAGMELIQACREVVGRYPRTADGHASQSDWGPLSHDIQLRGDIALREMERRGLHVDLERVNEIDRQLAEALEASKEVMAAFGYVPGKKGNRNEFNRIIKEAEQKHGVTIPTTPRSGDKTQAADDLAPLAAHEFVQAFLNYSASGKIQSTFISKLQSKIVYPHYNLLTNTGRTSCSSPNIQQLPREGHIRDCIVPSPGHVFIAADYAAIELCTLAQLTWSRFGHSRMRELINQGVDLHRFTASNILSKPEAEVTGEERRKAKAVNFGLPGGMGAKGLVAYAWTTYGVKMSLDEGARWREQWMTLFPEMRLYLQDDDLTRLIDAYDLSDLPTRPDEESAAMILLRIAGGAKETSAGRIFGKAELDWAWGKIADSPAADMEEHQTAIENRTGSRKLQKAIIPGQVAITPSGRIRAKCGYCESRNTPFQGMASDGAKLALYDLHRAGLRVVAFIHDEVLVEVPEAPDYRATAENISNIMVSAMQKVCPDIKIKTEYAVMRRWSKDAKALYDPKSRLIPWNIG